MDRRQSIITLGALFASLPLALYSNENGALIIESDKEEAKFKIGKDAFLLRPNSKIELSHDGTFTKALTLLGGGVMGVFGGGDKVIKTKTFTAGIRGTGIYLQEYAKDAVYSCLCYGKGDYKYNNSDEILFSIDAIHHDKPVHILQNTSGKLEYKISKTDNNHHDDELRSLEKMCGRECPFEAFLTEQKLKGTYKH